MQAVLSTTSTRGIESGKGGTILQRPVTMGGTEWLQGRRKVTTMSQALSSKHYIYFQNILGSNVEAPNLLLSPGAIYSRYAPDFNTSVTIAVKIRTHSVH